MAARSVAFVRNFSPDSAMSEARHLKRLDSIWQKAPIYFVTTCVADRRSLLANAIAHEILRDEWTGLRKRHGWAVGRYVIMPDHVHFFISPEAAQLKSLEIVIGAWKEWTAKRISKATGNIGRLWQAEFFDHLIRSDESRSVKWNYVHHNPVRAGLVPTPGDWPYAGTIDFD